MTKDCRFFFDALLTEFTCSTIRRFERLTVPASFVCSIGRASAEFEAMDATAPRGAYGGMRCLGEDTSVIASSFDFHTCTQVAALF